jgi:hypothetical protein
VASLSNLATSRQVAAKGVLQGNLPALYAFLRIFVLLLMAVPLPAQDLPEDYQEVPRPAKSVDVFTVAR